VTFSRFFTELIELAINLLYVKVLAKKGKATSKAGHHCPADQGATQICGQDLYACTPWSILCIRAVSMLDALIFKNSGLCHHDGGTALVA